MNDIRVSPEELFRMSEQSTAAVLKVVSDGEIISSIAFVKLAETGVIDEVTASENAKVFADWDANINYKVGDLRKISADGQELKLAKCIQAHKSQADWHPTKTPAMWNIVGDPAIEYPAWSQPIGAHDAYELGSKVTFKTKKYKSIVANNVWEPGVHGWELVK